MKRFVYSLTGAVILTLILTGALFAQDYIINITVNGTPVALSVTLDDNDHLTVTTKAPGVNVVSVLTPTRALAPTATPAAAQTTATATTNANLRSGPGTSFALAGTVTAGQTLTIIGQDATGNWLKLADGKWIAAFLVEQSTTASKPTPTATPRPSAALTANDRQAAEDYANDIYPILLEYGSAFDEIGSLFTNAPKNAAFDSDWRISVIYQLARIKASNNQLRALTAPVSLKPVHDQMLIGAEHYETAVNLVADWLDNFNIATIKQATTEIDAGQAAFDEAKRILDEIKGDVG